MMLYRAHLKFRMDSITSIIGVVHTETLIESSLSTMFSDKNSLNSIQFYPLNTILKYKYSEIYSINQFFRYICTNQGLIYVNLLLS